MHQGSARLRSPMILGFAAIGYLMGAFGINISIANDLEARGLKANPLMIPWKVFKYLANDKRVTVAETGQAGPLDERWETFSTRTAVFGFGLMLTWIACVS